MTVMPQIETVVVLMLENRSLDNLLGWLHEGDASVNIVPAGSQPPRFDGIAPAMANQIGWETFAPRRGFADLGEQRWRTPRQDPDESISGVIDQMYADGGGDRHGRGWSDAAPMTGFAVDYLRMLPPAPGEVMGAYTSDELPVLYGLAERFAVSDRWYSSVPTETDPNRDFAFCGTSEGKETDLDHPFSVSSPTVFNALDELDTTWAIYAQTDFGGAPFTDSGLTYSELHFDGVRAAVADPDSHGAVLGYDQLFEDLAIGRPLPAFCFIEPAWGWGLGDAERFVGWQGNDYHPPTWVGPAEAALADLFQAVATSEQWANMLFVVTFDEHGGTWDHSPPPSTVNPDGRVGPTGFTFERLGPRVPTLFMSPFIEPRTVLRPPLDASTGFDHTSIIRTVLEWAGADADLLAQFGLRVASAPRFDHVLSDVVVQPRPLLPLVPAEFRQQAPMGAHGLDTETLTRWSPADLRGIADASATIDEFLARLS